MGKKRFGVAVAVAFLALIHVSVSLPFVMLHGISAECSDETNSDFTRFLTDHSGSQGFCLEIGNGIIDSWFMPLTKQVDIACEKVKQMDVLHEGYNIVARSQGNLVARGLIEFCDDGPKVYNYVSLAGPHAGLSSVPFCNVTGDIAEYLEGSKYLPKLNNEIPSQRNATYKDRFTSLQNLVLVMFQDDNVIVPKESSWFGFYRDGAAENEPVLSANQTQLYTEDWIGLKTLVDAGKVKFVSVPGGHDEMADPDVMKYVVPYLQNNSSSVQKLNYKTKEPLPH
ncbi:unnamed protein product [Microthlaspi erraticum]|uniref:Palmitoyl-protein thioesterase 1 n=1 Tax=Microthlaspi erraticum TaxID=1685480 RepID=A0A6D2IAS3_9BRAS|nr:unnamed protein product [Microthlaspi erraticum]